MYLLLLKFSLLDKQDAAVLIPERFCCLCLQGEGSIVSAFCSAAITELWTLSITMYISSGCQETAEHWSAV
jgi:hypothetical protein